MRIYQGVLFSISSGEIFKYHQRHPKRAADPRTAIRETGMSKYEATNKLMRTSRTNNRIFIIKLVFSLNGT